MTKMGAEHGRLEGKGQEEDRKTAEERVKELRAKLQAIQKQRRRVRQLVNESNATLSKWKERHNEALYNREISFEQYKSLFLKNELISKELDYAQKWNVTNDCFLIWHSGPFGSINGIRLGSEVRVLAAPNDTSKIYGLTDQQIPNGNRNIGKGSSVRKKSNGTTTVTQTASVTPTSRSTYGSFFYGRSIAGGTPDGGKNSAANSQSPTNSRDSLSPVSSSTTLKVPWVEINSALGMVALLLSTLERKPNSGIRYRHEIIPMGSTSKIGLRPAPRGGGGNSGTSSSTASSSNMTVYNLYSDDAFSMFGKRNFNIALSALLRCMADATDAVQKRDKTIVLPHMIDISDREFQIGGLPISFDATDGERWTKAMKYLLTDLKWLIAYTTKHVDV